MSFFKTSYFFFNSWCQNWRLTHFSFFIVVALNEIVSVESLLFDFGTIKSATNNFSDDNKLGQGGFGSVYKGKLADEIEISVKRLVNGSGQGDIEFKNEVQFYLAWSNRPKGICSKESNNRETLLLIALM
ncbi:hypothetical protein QQ045_019358 [Rhodiola kirilowii]